MKQVQSPARSSARVAAQTWWLQRALALLFLALLAAIVLAQANPYLTLPNPDGGFNLFAGSQILKGRLPYVDFWNTKGPGIYYLNALALYLGHGLRWGVWVVEYLFLLGALVLLFVLMRRQWGAGAAALGILIAIAGLAAVFNGGNLTEEYPLLFNSVALYLFWSEGRDAAPRGASAGPWRYLLVGCMTGLSFSFRANNIGVPAAIVAACLLEDGLRRRYGSALRRLLLIGAGFVIPLGLGLLYFWLRGALSDYIGAVYLYNVRYSVSRTHPLSLLLAGFGPAKVGWPSWFALAGALLALVVVVRKLVRRQPVTGFEWFLALILWIELALSSVSWRMFGHYFISWMPAMALLSAYLFAQALTTLPPGWLTGFLQGGRPGVLYGSLLVALALIARADLADYARTAFQLAFHRGEGIEYRDYLSNYVLRHTVSGDRVLTWPANAWINFASRRDSPVRLVFYPVFDAGTITEAQGRGYLDDLAAYPPALILDCSDLQNEVPSLDAQTRQVQRATRDFLFDPPYIEQVFGFVASNYHVEYVSSKCTIYRKNP